MIQSNSPKLPRGAIGFALGIAGMLVSLYYSIMFIAGNATGTELAIGIVFALCLDYGKVALATEALLALASFRLLSAVVYSLIVISLYCLSMLAATFMLTAHNTSALATQYDSRVATIQKSIDDKKAQISACNQSYVSKCVNPRTAELTALQAELATAQNVSGDVIAAKNTAATWEKLAKILDSTPEELQVKLAFARAFILEIIAPIFVSLFLSTYRNRLSATHERIIETPEQVYAKEEQQAQPIQPQPQPVRYEQPQQVPQFTPIKYSGLKW